MNGSYRGLSKDSKPQDRWLERWWWWWLNNNTWNRDHKNNDSTIFQILSFINYKWIWYIDTRPQ
jgi:ATP-dependent exoDNAse (exonuclease V) alpha subunit